MTLNGLSTATQDYLKVVWSAREWADEPVTTGALAARLGVSPSTVSEAVKRLTEQGLLEHARYGAIELTPRGERVALGMVRRHRLLETYLVERLGYGWHEVHDEAEVLEHAVSDTFIDRIDEVLGHPTRDPHGDPIPAADGTFPALEARRLGDVDAPSSVSVARVSDSDPALLRWLAGSGLTVDSRLDVVERLDFAGTMGVEVAGQRVELGAPAIEAIWVIDTPDD